MSARYSEKHRAFLRANGGRYGVRQAPNGRWQVYDLNHVNRRTRASYADETKARQSAAKRNAAEAHTWAEEGAA